MGLNLRLFSAQGDRPLVSKDNNKNQEKQNYQHFFVNRSLFSRTNGRWPKGKAICNSAAMSWGFAIPTSTVLFVNLSNRITKSFCGESNLSR